MHEPERGDLYRHFKGGFYIVLHAGVINATNDANDEETYVFYKRVGNGDMYIRKYSEFVSKINGKQYRFKYIGNVLNDERYKKNEETPVQSQN